MKETNVPALAPDRVESQNYSYITVLIAFLLLLSLYGTMAEPTHAQEATYGTIPTLHPIPIRLVVPEAVRAGDEFTLTTVFTIQDSLMPLLQLTLNAMDDLAVVTQSLEVSSTTPVKDLKLSEDYTYVSVPLEVCPPNQIVASVVSEHLSPQQKDVATTLVYLLNRADILNPGDVVTATAVLKMISDSGVVPSSPVEILGSVWANTADGQHGWCDSYGGVYGTVDIKHEVFVPLITKN